MKKVFYTLFILCALFMYFYEAAIVSRINEGKKVVSKWYERISEKKSGDAVIDRKYRTDEIDPKVIFILPAYFWDTKMMIR